MLYDIAVRMRDAVAKERERQQAHQDILIAELNHRVRNILNLIRNVIGQTDARGLTVAQFSEVVSGRIEAMARAHDHIARRGWEDVSLMALLETEFSAFLDDGDAGRVTAEGPAVRLTAEAFSTISLVIHELLTNAVKHGALAGAGSVSIDWSLQPEGLELNWLEHGVPDLAPPERRGFGRTVIERLIPFDLKGEAEIEFAPGGLRCRFIVPDLHLRRSEGEAPRSAPRISPTPRLAAAERRQTSPAAKQEGKILIVEDNLLIALEYESIAFRAGVEEVVTVSGTKDALRAAEDRQRLAILDINLGTETTLPVARRLHELGVPLIFVTGYGEELTESTKGLAKKTFAKPVDNELLFASIAEILRASGKSDDP
ncbi:MAG: HWE histidine kinase domain-containing protein [Minwuia sp.]|uniref:HWE histidine kinase domain-containing protein n=1 Tax=Minwuia sp. TaxID=2493630 RepID=UPI003A84AA20